MLTEGGVEVVLEVMIKGVNARGKGREREV